jgi:phosphonate transport system substrate-binding protein
MKLRRTFCTLLGLFSVTAIWGDDLPKETLRVGVSYASFGTVNRDDASAALKAWAASLTKERKVGLKVEIEIFEGENDLRAALAREELEAASMTADELWKSGLRPESIFLTAKGADFAEKYVILVHHDAGIDDLAGLKGRKLVRHVSPTTSSALPWLETVLADRGLGRVENLFGEITTTEKPSKGVLQVFFHQADACLLSAGAFEVACELNPQLRKNLKVMAVSPPLISTVLFFRSSCTSHALSEMEATLLELDSSVAGQQVLTVFQSSRMLKQPLASFEPTRRVLTDYHRLVDLPGQETATTSAAKTGGGP